MQGPLHLDRHDCPTEIASVDQMASSLSILQVIHSSNVEVALPIYNFVHCISLIQKCIMASPKAKILP